MLDFENYDKPIWPKDDTERALIENGRIRDKLAAEAALRAEARRHTYAVHYPSRAFRIEANWDAEYGAEWALSEAALLADENATLTAQLTHYATTKERLTTERILLDDARREIAALRAENATLCEKLDAATARLAERENAALVADATDVCAGFSAAALYRMYTLEKGISEERRRAVERLTARLNGAQLAADIGLDDAHEDDDDATPATLGDRRQQETRSIEWTPPTRSKPDAAA